MDTTVEDKTHAAGAKMYCPLCHEFEQYSYRIAISNAAKEQEKALQGGWMTNYDPAAEQLRKQWEAQWVNVENSRRTESDANWESVYITYRRKVIGHRYLPWPHYTDGSQAPV